MSNVYSGGLGGTTGDELATYDNLVISPSNSVLYVHFATGTDSGSFGAGRERLQPLKTLAQAYTNASAGDVIVFLSGHAETLTATQTINKAGLRLVSEGNGLANMAKFTTNGAIVTVFNVTAAAVLLANFYFPTGLVANSAARIITGSVSGGAIRGCYFDCSAKETSIGAIAPDGSTYCRITDCTFVSTATVTSAVPPAAILTANPVSDLTLDGCTFDAGTVGWASGYGVNFGDAVTRLYAVNIDLLGGSDFNVTSGSYVINIRNRTGSARLIVNS